jgi:hypothetical protein
MVNTKFITFFLINSVLFGGINVLIDVFFSRNIDWTGAFVKSILFGVLYTLFYRKKIQKQ